MLDQDTRDQLVPVARTAQIIVAALIGGCLFLSIMLVIVFNTDRADKPLDELPVVAYVGAGVAVVCGMTRVVIGPVIANASGKNSSVSSNNVQIKIDDPEANRAASGWMTSQIVKNALLEGAALLNAIAFFVHGQMWSLGIVGALLAWMAVGFPQLSQLEDHIDAVKSQIA